MVKQLSYSKYENIILPKYRKQLNIAESTEDIKKFFIYACQELFENIFEDNIKLQYNDIILLAESEPNYKLSERLHSYEYFETAWKHSDLPNVLRRLAKKAANRYKRLEKHPKKTAAKIRM
jgi:hypothetical protein